MPNPRVRRFSFGPSYRLNKKTLIDDLFQTGRHQVQGFMRFKVKPTAFGYTRVVISISKRVGNSPERNRLKRLIREGLRQSGALEKHSLDCGIFITRTPARKPEFRDVAKYLDRFFSSLAHEPEGHP